MIRVVVAVVLTTALLGVSFPAIDDARRDHSETAVRAELDAVERAATDLLATDDPAADGARRIVVLQLPTRSWTDAGTEEVTIGAARNGSGGRVTWLVDDDSTRRVRYLPDVPIRTDTDARALTLTESGRHRLVLALEGDATDPVVTVRTFTSDGGTSEVHATVAANPGRRTGRRVRL